MRYIISIIFEKNYNTSANPIYYSDRLTSSDPAMNNTPLFKLDSDFYIATVPQDEFLVTGTSS